MSTTPVRQRLRPRTPDPMANNPDLPWDEPEVEAAPATVAPGRTVPQATIDVSRVDPNGEVNHSERVTLPMFHGPVAEVEVRGGVTRNTGDYNSARVDVCVRIPCYPVDSAIEAAYLHASRLVDQWVTRELDIATGVIVPDGE